MIRADRLRGLGLIFVTALYGFPLVYMVATSLKTRAQVFESPANLLFTPTLAAYADLWSPALARAALNSAVIAFGTTALVLALATPAAFWLARGRGLLITLGLASLILLQMVPQANTVIPLFQIMGSLRLLDGLHSVIIADAALLTPFAIILLRPFFAAIPREVEQAAQVDGASQFQTFSRVSLPLARNGMITVGTLVWIIAWGEFLYAITFLTSAENKPLSGILGGQITQFGIEWERLMAMAVIVALPVLVVFIATERRLSEGLAVGAGK